MNTEARIIEIKNRLRHITKGPWTLMPPLDRYGNGAPWIKAPKENPKHGYDIEVFGEDDTQYSTQRADFTFAAHAPEDIKFLLELIAEKV